MKNNTNNVNNINNINYENNTIENNFFDMNVIFRVLYKNKFFIAITSFLFLLFSTFLALNLKSYKTEINLYGNDRVLNEIGEQSQFSLNSFDFLYYLKNNSESLKQLQENLNETDQEFLENLSSILKVQSENNSPHIKVTFINKNLPISEIFQQEYTEIAQSYLNIKKNDYTKAQLTPLEREYNFIKENINIENYKDPTIDSLIGKLSYYRILLNDETPLVKLISSNTKNAVNKKLIVAVGTLLGIFLSIFISFSKEFLKSLNWENIKNK